MRRGALGSGLGSRTRRGRGDFGLGSMGAGVGAATAAGGCGMVGGGWLGEEVGEGAEFGAEGGELLAAVGFLADGLAYVNCGRGLEAREWVRARRRVGWALGASLVLDSVAKTWRAPGMV